MSNRSWHGDFGQEVLVRDGEGWIFTNNTGWFVAAGRTTSIWASVLAECPTEQEAVEWLRCWRLLEGLNEDGTKR